MVGCGVLGWTLGGTGGISPWIPGGRRDPTKDPRWGGSQFRPWEGWAGSCLGSWVGPRAGMAGSRQSHLGSQVGLAGSRLNPAWLFNWGFCCHHSILKSYLTTFTSSPMRQIYFHLTMIRQRERTLRQICRRSQNISHRIFTD